MPSSHPWNCIESKDHQRGSIETYFHHVLYPQSAQASLARSCSEDGCWANLKITIVWRVSRWQKQPRSSKLRLKDVCKRDLKNLNIRSDELELLSNDRAKWRSTVHKRLKEREKNTLRNQTRWRNETQNELY